MEVRKLTLETGARTFEGDSLRNPLWMCHILSGPGSDLFISRPKTKQLFLSLSLSLSSHPEGHLQTGKGRHLMAAICLLAAMFHSLARLQHGVGNFPQAVFDFLSLCGCNTHKIV